MVIHEGGHLLAARAFGMRVIRFSIGFGPALWRHQPKGSDTVYQVALIPFLAYVQIAGMNPLEEVDPDDKGSYANASLVGRISAIVAGPLANYLFASVFFFVAFLIGGEATKVQVMKDGAAERAGLANGDKVLSIDGTKIERWEQIPEMVLPRANKKMSIVVQRGAEQKTIEVVPEPKAKGGGGQIGVRPVSAVPALGVKEAAVESIVHPAKVVEALVVGLGRMITGREKPEVSGPVGIVKETSRAAEQGPAEYLFLLGLLSAYLGGFNLLPFPALDGGRLMFLSYEAVTRRRPNAKIEAHVHAVGLLMLLALIAVVSVFDIRGK
ncbi:MAG: site-2 protease family protein [Polyangiaceae bacterium]|nr:site-2 protease family protein [Polyangiaceae bacterium]MCE7893671.1 RIP metalloprotease [Sorangiineae bacterium PRO1]MCL4752825.1 M50 family metallopeptidase [Myxococcales bacterium]